MFELKTLGRLELRDPRGRVVHAVQTRPKDLVLLVFLAARQGFQRRDALLPLLWPDLDESHARNALSQALHRLRFSLAKDLLLVRGREEVGLAKDRLWCDVVAFDRSIDDSDLVSALALYSGDFLSGFHVSAAAADFERWVEIERERLQRRAFNAARLLAQVEDAAGNDPAAVRWLRRADEIRPLDEGITRRLMRALDTCGDAAGALDAYERFRRRFAEEYDSTPAAETAAVAEKIKNRRGPRAVSRLRQPSHARVLEWYLKGRYFTSTITQTARGLECLGRSIDLEPTWPPPHAALAMALVNLALLGQLPPSEARASVKSAVERALELDDGSSDGHTALATSRMMFDWDWDGAEREFRIAIGCDAENADAHTYLAVLLSAVARYEEAIREAMIGQQLDPLGVWSNFIFGWVLYRARRHPESIEKLHDLLELYPHLALTHLFLAENYLQQGAYADAVAECRTALEKLPDSPLLIGISACVFGLAGEQPLAHRLSDVLEEIERTSYASPGLLAAAQLGMGNIDRAFELWDAMFFDRSSIAFLVPTDPLYDSARADPRFTSLARRLLLPVESPGGGRILSG